eukprot:3143971-Amphidinium_carterae.1
MDLNIGFNLKEEQVLEQRATALHEDGSHAKETTPIQLKQLMGNIIVDKWDSLAVAEMERFWLDHTATYIEGPSQCSANHYTMLAIANTPSMSQRF